MLIHFLEKHIMVLKSHRGSLDTLEKDERWGYVLFFPYYHLDPAQSTQKFLILHHPSGIQIQIQIQKPESESE